MIRVKAKEYKSLGTGAVAYEGIILKREIGWIRIACNVYDAKCNIQLFHVKDKYRRKGIGRKLLEEAEKELKKHDYSILEVCPCPESFDDEADISIEELYMMYSKLGFEFEDKKADLSKRGNKMYKKIG